MTPRSAVNPEQTWQVAGADPELFRRAIEVTSAITMVLDASGVITSVNDAFTRCLGHDRTDVVGRPLTSFAQKLDETLLTDALARLRAGGDRET
ncbi:MAG: PAS domain-containing protein, partial [Actinomycetota bacterium]